MAEEQISCHLCEDKGVVVKNDIAYRCKCLLNKKFSHNFQQSNINGILKYHTFENFDFNYYPSKFCTETNTTYFKAAQKVYNAALNFCKKIEKGNFNQKGLFFCGSVGSGKTFLASCIANRLLSNSIEVLFAVVPDLLDTIKATYDDNTALNEREINVLNKAKNIPILILDDLGAHNYTNWARNKIFSIINHRVNYNLPTIITSNEELETLELYLGERTTSRIFQLCDSYMIFTPEDIRLVMNKKNKYNQENIHTKSSNP